MQRTICALACLIAATAHAEGSGLRVNSASTAVSTTQSGAVNQNYFEATTIPANTTATINNQGTVTTRNVPGVVAFAPAMMGAASGPCVGNSRTKSGGVSAGWVGFGGGVSAGDGESFLDWGCEQERAFRVNMIACQAGDAEACTDAVEVRKSMGPNMVVRGKAEAPSYATVKPKPEPAQKQTEVAPGRVVLKESYAPADGFAAGNVGKL